MGDEQGVKLLNSLGLNNEETMKNYYAAKWNNSTISYHLLMLVYRLWLLYYYSTLQHSSFSLSLHYSIPGKMDKLYNADSAKGYEPLTDEEKDAMSDSAIEEWENKIKDSMYSSYSFCIFLSSYA